jgi:hypothetical protein
MDKLKSLAIEYEVSESTIYGIRNKIISELGFCEDRNIEIFLIDRLNIKKLVQDLMQDKGAIDIIDLFDFRYMAAYRFLTQIYIDKKTITDNQYDKCMLIINKFDKE